MARKRLDPDQIGSVDHISGGSSERGSGPWGVLQATKASLKGRGGLGGAHRVLEQEETRRRRVSGDGVGELVDRSQGCTSGPADPSRRSVGVLQRSSRG